MRRKMVEYSPSKTLRKLAKLLDTISDMSKYILETKKEALAAGDTVLLEQIGEGKDIISILCTTTLWDVDCILTVT